MRWFLVLLIIFNFINLSFAGEKVRYKTVSKLSEYAHIVSDESGKVGLYDPKEKKLIVPIIYDKIEGNGYSDHFLYKDNKVGSIKLSGEVIFPVEYEALDCKHSNFCITKKNNKYGAYGYYEYRNVRTDINIPNIYDEIIGDKNVAKLIVKMNGKYGVLNYDNTIFLPIEYTKIQSTNYTYDLIVEKNGKQGIFTQNGKVRLPIKYDNIDYSQGKFFIKDKDKTYLLFAKGKHLIEMDNCRDGFVRCEYPMNKNKVGYASKNNYLAIPMRYDDLIRTRHHGTQHIAVNNGKYGLTQGYSLALPIEYESIEEDRYNYIVKKNGKYGLFNGYNSGTEVEYDSIKQVAYTLERDGKEYYAVEKDGKIGCLAYDKGSKKYEQIFEIKYEEVTAIKDKDESFAIKQNGKYAIVNPTKKKEVKFVYNNFKNSMNFVKVKKGCIWYYKDPEEVLKTVFKPFYDIWIFFIWHFGSF